ncbi:MAG: hypothetical protein QOJ76_692 [Acidobacteriota bacterium]|jgi:uncharacterized membrane protein YhhN|nr:hypothetical protein [Acidobacteriota bacterium]
MSHFPGGVLCASASFMLLLCALHLWAHESVSAGVFVALIAFGLLLSAMRLLKSRRRW